MVEAIKLVAKDVSIQVASHTRVFPSERTESNAVRSLTVAVNIH